MSHGTQETERMRESLNRQQREIAVLQSFIDTHQVCILWIDKWDYLIVLDSSRTKSDPLTYESIALQSFIDTHQIYYLVCVLLFP